MKNFGNKRKKKFISDLSELPSLEDKNNDLTIRSKFNCSYFDSSQTVGQKFSDWSHKQLYDLLGKIKDYTTKPLDHWKRERVGRKGSTVLAIYGNFPSHSHFKRPKYIPHQAQWGRFRIGSELRLVGFIIPTTLHKTLHIKTGEFFDKNTFYVVFFDRDHKFYP